MAALYEAWKRNLMGEMKRQRELPRFWSPTPVIGYRTWSFETRGPGRFRLTGSYNGVWDNATMEAACGNVPELVEADSKRDPNAVARHIAECSCGFYAFKSPNEVWGDGVAGNVVGRVLMWGAVVEARLGYRSALCTIDTLVAVCDVEADFRAGLWGDAFLRYAHRMGVERAYALNNKGGVAEAERLFTTILARNDPMKTWEKVTATNPFWLEWATGGTDGTNNPVSG